MEAVRPLLGPQGAAHQAGPSLFTPEQAIGCKNLS